jgi:syndetin
MSNSSLFIHGMAKIHEIGLDLQQSAVMCKNGRRLLAQTKTALTTHGLVIRAKHRKRELYRGIAADLTEIQLILSNERHLRDALNEGDFPRAIALCVACHASLRAYEQFTCLASFQSYVQSSWELLQRRVESAVRDVVRKFDATTYERVLVAHRRMGRGYHVIERLQRQFIDTINENTKNALYAHVLQSERNAMRAEELKAMNFKNLAEALDDKFFVECLHTILEYMADLLFVHWQMSKWHERRAAADAADAAAAAKQAPKQKKALAAKRAAAAAAADNDDDDDGGRSDDDNENDDDDDTDSKYFAGLGESLSRFRKTMWDKIQRKVAAILSTSQLANYKIDEFLHVLDSIYRFIAIGEAFSGCDSDHMRRSIKLQSKQYFENMHKRRMEDLSIMLANEHWHPCPVADDFELDRIKEFAPMSASTLLAGTARADGDTSSAAAAASDAERIFAEQARSGNPFSKAALQAAAAAASKARREVQLPAAGADASAQAAAVAAATPASAADADATDEGEKRNFLTSTCINVAKFIGKYLQMMQILEPISYQIFVGLEQIYNFYLYAVFKFFVESVPVPGCFAELPALQHKALPGELRQVLAAFSAKLDELGAWGKGLLPRMDESVTARLADANGCYGAAKRAVALESLCVLAEATRRLKPRLAQLLAARPGADKKLKEFMASSVAHVPALRRHGYVVLSSVVLPFENLCRLVENTNWATTKNVETQCNDYVARYREEYRLFAVRAQTLQQEGAIPRAVFLLLWRQAVSRGMDTLIEGFARAKKCTDQGQLLRKLDLQELCSELNSLVPKQAGRPLPRHEDVALYIRAYYQEADHFLPFVKEHNTKFTQKQILSVINQGFGKDMKKPNRKDLEKTIEEIYAMQEAAAAAVVAAAAAATAAALTPTLQPRAAEAAAAAPKVAVAPSTATAPPKASAPASAAPAVIGKK